ncbi:unnamed protein product [Acanthoscelides obtectus]|uniref:Uncharacterized protein n=1 Tax=Acanthoscelides obtectus TaxID=200917 RepID=A0A9P0KRH4_ACAOB|nr:unnamed protein product [Acanthoscelides obtectus]CAK1677361.1 hypothetical protein AOBTE_LOCUS31269 [Acanthoscelides obtectus]
MKLVEWIYIWCNRTSNTSPCSTHLAHNFLTRLGGVVLVDWVRGKRDRVQHSEDIRVEAREVGSRQPERRQATGGGAATDTSGAGDHSCLSGRSDERSSGMLQVVPRHLPPLPSLLTPPTQRLLPRPPNNPRANRSLEKIP